MLLPGVDEVADALAPRALVEALREAFADNAPPQAHASGGTAKAGSDNDGASQGLSAPLRTHHVVPSPVGDANDDTHLLIMPAWQRRAGGGLVGIKLVSVNARNPSRRERPQPMVQGIYLLLDAGTGEPLAQFDAQELTFRRTAAVSALGADYLARPDVTSLGVLGAGAAMAPYLINAYRAVRPAIDRLVLWNRTPAKAQALAERLAGWPDYQGVKVTLAAHSDQVVGDVDIVTSCTPSLEPLIRGALLKPGVHVDCLGGFRPTMREADDDVIRRASVFCDTRPGVLAEAGDIMIPIANGVLTADGITGDLFDLCAGRTRARTCTSQITYFKSVGSALSDFAAASLVYSRLS